MMPVSEADACRWLGRRVCVVTAETATVTVGRLQHVSSRSAFILEEDTSLAPFGGSIRLIPLAGISRIDSADREGGSP